MINKNSKNVATLLRKNRSLLKKVNTQIKDVQLPKTNSGLLRTEIVEQLTHDVAKVRKTALIRSLAMYVKLVNNYTSQEMSDLEVVLAYYAHRGEHTASYVFPKLESVRHEIVLGFGLILNYVMYPNEPNIVVYADEQLDELFASTANLTDIFEAIKIPVVVQMAKNEDITETIDTYKSKIVFTIEEFYLDTLIEDNLINEITNHFTTPIHLYLMDAYTSLIDPAHVKIARRYNVLNEKPDPFIPRVKTFVETLTSSSDPTDQSVDVWIEKEAAIYQFTAKGEKAVRKEFGEQALDSTTRLGGRLHAGMAAQFLLTRAEQAVTPTEYQIENGKLVKLNIYIPNVKEAIEAKEGLEITLPMYVANELTMLNTLPYALLQVAFVTSDVVPDTLQLLGLRQLKPFRFETISSAKDSRIERIDFEQSLGQSLYIMNAYIGDLRNHVLEVDTKDLNVEKLFPHVKFETKDPLVFTDDQVILAVTTIMDAIREYLKDYLADVEAIRGGILSDQVFKDNYYELVDNLDIALRDAQLKALTLIFKDKNLIFKESETQS